MPQPYHIIQPSTPETPIIISVPHSGTDFPSELEGLFEPVMMAKPDDTDWNVHDLYNFASKLGITIIHAKYSRWVIDLNRDPKSVPLYNDGRLITGITPTTDFFGNPIYKEEKDHPNELEVQRRLDTYYWPYYKKIEALIEAKKAKFGHALLWDAHSIRHFVPTIRETRFPDMILGNNDETTAHKNLIQTTLNHLKKGSFEVAHNTPFKGGHITRYFGKPEKNIHALQLEMNKLLYMDDTETKYHPERAQKVREVLEPTFIALLQQLKELSHA